MCSRFKHMKPSFPLFNIYDHDTTAWRMGFHCIFSKVAWYGAEHCVFFSFAFLFLFFFFSFAFFFFEDFGLAFPSSVYIIFSFFFMTRGTQYIVYMVGTGPLLHYARCNRSFFLEASDSCTRWIPNRAARWHSLREKNNAPEVDVNKAFTLPQTSFTTMIISRDVVNQ